MKNDEMEQKIMYLVNMYQLKFPINLLLYYKNYPYLEKIGV